MCRFDSDTGIAGRLLRNLQYREGPFRIGCLLYTSGDKPYYSAPHLVFPSGIVEAWTEPETFLPVSVERDASGLERLLLPDLLTATPELFPDSEQLWGETGEASYIYYETLTMGGIAVPVPIEYHRHVVLTRQQP